MVFVSGGNAECGSHALSVVEGLLPPHAQRQGPAHEPILISRSKLRLRQGGGKPPHSRETIVATMKVAATGT